MSREIDRNGESWEHRNRMLAPMCRDVSDFDFAAVARDETPEDVLFDALLDGVPGITRQQVALAVGIAKRMARTEETPTEDAIVFAETLRNVISHIEVAGVNAAREAQLHRFAFDFRESNAESMRAVARAWGVSVEAISKRVAAIRTRHQLALNSFNKSADVAETHRLTNRRRR